MLQFNRNKYDTILGAIIVSEILLLFYFRTKGITSQFVNSFAFTLSSLSFGIVLLLKFYKFPNLKISERNNQKHNYILYAIYAGIFLVLNDMTIRLMKVYDAAGSSDIIPFIGIIVRNFLSGKVVYSAASMVPFGYSNPPGYLPMHWLPFTIAEHFHFDYRSITFSIWFFASSIVFFRSLKCDSLLIKYFILITIGGSYFLMLQTNGIIMGATVEMMIAGYYMLFIIGQNKNNVLLTAATFTICLLSRYSIALWLPLWCFIMFVSGAKRQLFSTVFVVFVSVCLIYIFPFLSKDWNVLINSFKNYNDDIGQWYQLCDVDRPCNLYTGTGFAFLFYEHFKANDILMHKGFDLLKITLYCTTITALVSMGLWYWLNHQKINRKIFIMASYKIYLTFFLAFILVPFSYLMVTAIYVSIAIFVEQARYSPVPNNADSRT